MRGGVFPPLLLFGIGAFIAIDNHLCFLHGYLAFKVWPALLRLCLTASSMLKGPIVAARG
jgi:hypothetical protein